MKKGTLLYQYIKSESSYYLQHAVCQKLSKETVSLCAHVAVNHYIVMMYDMQHGHSASNAIMMYVIEHRQ